MGIYDYDAGPGSSDAALVFLHAALADRRMWRHQWSAFQGRYQLLAVDLRGFGEHPPSPEPFKRAANIAAAMDEVGIERAILVGTSMGTRVALDLAATRAERVAGLALFAPVGPSHDWSPQVQQLWADEEAALEAGDLDLAVELNLNFWLDGPNRTSANLSEQDRTLVADMQRRSFEHELAHPDAGGEVRFDGLEPALVGIDVAVSLIVGDEDADDIAQIARRLETELPMADVHQIPGTAHLPPLEVPEIANQLIEQLIDRVGVSNQR